MTELDSLTGSLAAYKSLLAEIKCPYPLLLRSGVLNLPRQLGVPVGTVFTL
jgi:hypothetical protein